MSTGITPRQRNAGREHAPSGTTSRTPRAAARRSRSRCRLRRSNRARAEMSSADGAPVTAAKVRALRISAAPRTLDSPPTGSGGQAWSQGAPSSRAAAARPNGPVSLRETRATTCRALDTGDPASSIAATSSSASGPSRDPATRIPDGWRPKPRDAAGSRLDPGTDAGRHRAWSEPATPLHRKPAGRAATTHHAPKRATAATAPHRPLIAQLPRRQRAEMTTLGPRS